MAKRLDDHPELDWAPAAVALWWSATLVLNVRG
jgi:hypothetical protein